MPARAPLDAAAVSRRVLRAGELWTSLEVCGSVTSSNEVLAARAASGAAIPGAVLVAEEQTRGRGRRDRGWVAPVHSSVMVSVLVRPEVDPATWSWVPMLTALAVTDALRRAGVLATIKWPNDVVVDDAKVCGILCEVVTAAGGPAIVAGWGLNVDQVAGELPGGATSVRICHGNGDRTELLVGSLRAFARWYREWHSDPRSPRAVQESRRRSATLGRPVQAVLPDGSTVHGTAVGLDSNGHLVLDVAGVERTIAAADVVHLRSEGLRR